MTDQNQKLPENANQKWPDPPWSIPPYVVYTPNPITPGASLSATAWVLSSGSIQASTDFNFQTNQSFYNNSVSQASLLQTNTRASTAYADDTAGNWQVFPAATPRVTNKGYLYEGEARTNSIRTSDMTGAVVADGIELTTNGNLALAPGVNGQVAQDTLQNGWQWNISSGTGTVTWNGSNSVTLTGDGTNFARFSTGALTTIVGLTYTITCDVSSNISSIFVGTSRYNNNLLSVNTALGTGQKFQFVATTTTTFFSFGHVQATPSTVANISVLSAGKLPNNWGFGNAFGLITSVVGRSINNGLNCLDVNYSGQSTSGFIVLQPDLGPPSGVYGQTVTFSSFVAFVGGSMTNVTNVQVYLQEQPSSTNGTAVIAGPTGTLTRYQTSYTVSVASTANLKTVLQLNFTANQNINITIRYAVPQLELNPSVDSSVASAVVVNGGTGGTYVVNDLLTVVGGSPNTATVLQVASVSGTQVATVTVQTPGDYPSATGLPASPVSVTGGGGTGATFTLTPVNQVALGYGMASSPTPTTSAAVTRAADTNSPFTITTGAGTTLYTKAIPLGSWTSNAQVITQIDDGGSNNEIVLDFLQGFQQAQIHAGGSGIYSQLGAGWTALVSSRLAVSSVSGAQLFSVDGSTVTAGSNSTKPTGMVNLRVGSFPGNSVPFMGYIQRVTVFNIALSQTALNAL